MSPKLTSAVGRAVEAAIHDPSVPLSSVDAPAAVSAIAQAVAADPTVQHLANAEPWYRSRVTWGAIIAVASPLIGIVVGRDLGPDEQTILVEVGTALGTAFGAGLTLYGRWRAKAPLGKAV